MKSITIAIATYNDEGSLQNVLDEIDILIFEQNRYFNFSILFVDDGSTDNSLNTLKGYQKGKENVVIHENPTNLGFGPTFKLIFTLPTSEWVFFNTGDNQFPMDNFTKLSSDMGDADVIVGIRELREDNWKRKLNSKLYNWCVNLFLKQKVKDVNSILLFKRSIINEIQLTGKSAFVNAELLIKVDKLNYKIKTSLIKHRKRDFGVGSGGKWKVIYPAIKDFLMYIFSER